MKSSNKRTMAAATAGAISIGLGLSLLASQAIASPYVIHDNYIGEDPTDSSYDGKDIIGDASLFEISKMEVSFVSPDMMAVDVYSRYFNNIGMYETQLGDLFVSTDGYGGDGEDWEYALQLDDYSGGTSAGALNLYEVEEGNIIESSAPDRYIYRAEQEVQYDSSNLTSLGTGSWELFNIGGSDEDDYLRFAIAYDFGDVSEFGFHWTMTCGNDVIEGGAPAPVPEPATALLFGAGLAGLAGVVRRKKK